MVEPDNWFGVLPRPKPALYPVPPKLTEFYHGTTLDNANKMLTDEIGVYSVASMNLLDESEYTDFGKGFYIHPPENRKLAIQWAKNHASKAGTEWGVLCARMTPTEFDGIAGQKLIFATKNRDRPSNAPVLDSARERRRNLEKKVERIIPWLTPGIEFDEGLRSFFDQRCNWIEFVEFNRHIKMAITRPKDNDWTNDYSLMRGPIWVQKDSGLPGKLPPFPEDVQQINLGVEGLRVLNAPAVKARRYVINKQNENLPPPP